MLTYTLYIMLVPVAGHDPANLMRMKQLLYQLSYTGENDFLTRTKSKSAIARSN